MELSAYLTHLRADGDGLAAAARLGTEAPIAGCPGWTVADLTEHVGRVHRWVVRSLTAPTLDRVAWVDPADPNPGSDLAGWYEERIDELIRELSARDPDHAVWTFTGPQTVGWWIRRQAHETTVHRWDAQTAHGAAAPIDPALASDGVDEYLAVFLPRWAKSMPVDGTSVHVHSTDAAGEWLIACSSNGPVVTREHAKGDAAVRGPAEALVLTLWNRVGPDAVEVVGDEAAYAAVIGALAGP